MATARVLKSGTSQAIRLAKAFRIDAGRTAMSRRDDEAVRREKPGMAAAIFGTLASRPDDFIEAGRNGAPCDGADKGQRREGDFHALAVLSHAIAISDLPRTPGTHGGATRARLQKAGVPTHNPSTAARGLAEDLTVVTSIARAVGHIEGPEVGTGTG